MRIGALVRSGLIVAGAAILTVATGLNTIGNIQRVRTPAAAARIPLEKQAQVLQIDRALLSRRQPLTRAEVFPVARRALAYNPLDPIALRLMAMASDPQTQSPESIAFVRIVDRLTRRDLLTQLILIEEAVRRGSVDEALMHYDQALRTNPESSRMLYPILNSALADGQIRRALGPYYVAGTPWFTEFVNFASAQPGSAAPIADLLAGTGTRKNLPLLEVIAPPLLTRLVQQYEFARAERLLLSLPGASRAILDRAEWTALSTGTRFGLLAWQPMTSETGSVSFENGTEPHERQLYVFARPGVQMVALTKVLALRPGSYRLSQASSFQSRGSGAAAYWELGCLNKGEEVPAWKSGNVLDFAAGGAMEGPLIPATCRYQRLKLVVSGGDGQDGLDMQVRNFQLAPVR